MKRLTAPVILLALFAACGAIAGVQKREEASAQHIVPQYLEPFLPKVGVHASRTMILMMPRQGVAILERMVAAFKQRPEWIDDWSQHHRDADGRLAYHPNLGISEEEYRLLRQFEKQMTLGEVERGELKVTQRPDGGLELSSGGHASYLNGIVLYPEKDFVETRYGRLSLRTRIDQTDPRSPTGPWQGVQWRSDNKEGGPVVKLAVGKRPSGEMIIYYDVTPSSDETLVLLYN